MTITVTTLVRSLPFCVVRLSTSLRVCYLERTVYSDRVRYSVVGTDLLQVFVKWGADNTGTRVISDSSRGGAVLEHVLLSSGSQLTCVIVHRRLARVQTNALEGRDRHSSQEADDDNHDHGFNEGKTLLKCFFMHNMDSYFMLMLNENQDIMFFLNGSPSESL